MNNLQYKIAAEDRRGFTIVEVIVILAIIGILAAVAVPMALRIFERTAEEATREEMDNLRMAMIGNPRKLQSTFRSDFGFLGDMGRIPANLDEILVRGSLPAFVFDVSKQAGAGWKGPYITGAVAGEEPEDFKNDQLGNPYVYSDADFTNANGEQADGKITSAGPDGTIGTGDDIVLEILKNETTANLRGSIKDATGNGIAGVSVDLNYPSNGTLAVATATTDTNGSYAFLSVPFGSRSVQVNASAFVLIPGSIVSDNDDIQFQVANLSSNPVVIDQMVAVFSGGANYDEIEIDNDTVDSGNNFDSGEIVDLDPGDISNGDTTFTAGSAKPPLRIIADNASTQLPNIVLTPGTARTVELNNFNNDPRGIPIAVSFIQSGVVVGSVSFTP